ncbi:hypothetical protein NKI01_30445 [Mesorhizobium sp. M0815]|uniref:hypothetical protein n=1 Tax=Mesorhizobium sp. M0815 TaxID=2957005 RepID=UPI0033364030
MTNRLTNRPTLAALAFALCSTALFAGGAARAEDAMKPANAMATNAMKPATDAMKPAGAMALDAMATTAMKAGDPMKADCMDKAAAETDAMKKAEATKACDAMAPAK